MTEIMCMLINDHRNMTTIIDVLDRRIGSLDRTGSADYGLVKQIVEYLLDYPTRVHHPVEDLVYGRLRTRDPAAAQALDGIEWEHGELEKRTRRFATAVDRALRGEELSPRWLAQMGRDLVERLRGHMAAEETRLFPAARGGLTPGDWADVALFLGAPDDPLFGPRLRESTTDAFTRRSLVRDNPGERGIPGPWLPGKRPAPARRRYSDAG
jgi:hemerythrin-like domain-containing protein